MFDVVLELAKTFVLKALENLAEEDIQNFRKYFLFIKDNFHPEESTLCELILDYYNKALKEENFDRMKIYYEAVFQVGQIKELKSLFFERANCERW